jgi:hypothetical protein
LIHRGGCRAPRGKRAVHVRPKIGIGTEKGAIDIECRLLEGTGEPHSGLDFRFGHVSIRQIILQAD